MAHTLGAVNRAGAVSAPVCGTADAIVDMPSRAFGMLPNAIACDPDLNEGALVMLAARVTYGGAWVMTRNWAASLVRRGLGEHCYWRGLGALVDRGLIKRRRQANGRQGHGEIVDDRVCLPADAGAHSRRVERSWFNGRLSVKAVASLCFIRAQADGEAQPWRIARRFGWSLATVKSAAEELCRGGLVERLGGAHNPTYRACNSQDPRCKKARSKYRRCKKARHLHSDQPLRSDQSSHTDQLLRKTRKRASFDVQGGGTDGTSQGGSASPPSTAPSGDQQRGEGNRREGAASAKRRQLPDRTADVLSAVAVERQSQEQARLGECEQAIARGDREPWTPDLLHRIAGMGVDVAALVTRYRERAAGRAIDDPNAYLLAMAHDALAKRMGTTREVVAAVATDRATLAGPAPVGRDARAQAESREALARQLGGGDIAAGYAALAMIPDSPRRKGVGPAGPLPESGGAVHLGAVLPMLGIDRRVGP
jgi:hypothetical protein